MHILSSNRCGRLSGSGHWRIQPAAVPTWPNASRPSRGSGMVRPRTGTGNGLARLRRVYAIARTCELGGHWVSAREAYFRASTYFHISYFPLFGAPTDPWLADAYRQEADAFRRAAVLR